MDKYDFSGWATRNNLKCSDGRVIMKDAFKGNDGQTVPLVWNHSHNDPLNVLGHALLENRPEGVYAYGIFNDTQAGQEAKKLVEHGDVNQLSIYANQLKQQKSNVIHGNIRELSLVLAGANPGAYIDTIISHSDDVDEEAIIFTGEDISLSHAEDTEKEEKPVAETKTETAAKGGEKTIKDVFDTLNEEQKTAVYAIIGEIVDEAGLNEEDSTEEGDDENMKHNVFDQDDDRRENVLSHSDMETILKDAKRCGSLRDSVESFLSHADYGIDQIDYLFPDAKNVTATPQFIQRDMSWVSKVMNGFHHTPFSRIKSIYADITEDEARAKGYIKGKMKKEEVFSLLKRTTTPQTVYKKQKLDRDDVIDITDFDVVAWLKSEMRIMLDEEIARAALIGDGRLSSDDDKINETNIRPIWKDEDLYTIKVAVDGATKTTSDDRAKEFIRMAIKARKDYKGSGNPTLYTTEDIITDCLLLTDSTGRDLYDSIDKLATKLRVKEIVSVPVMEDQKREGTSSDAGNTFELMGLIVNLEDYNVGADKGGAVNMFDDFDIDYNQQKYLIETRCSGALIKPYSAIAIELKTKNV